MLNDLRKKANEEFKTADTKLNRNSFVGKYIEENFEEEMKRGLVQKEDMADMIREAVQFTQWEYFATSMPLHYRSNAAKGAMVFQSWIQNYYGSHLWEAGIRMKHGRDSSGRVLEPYGRVLALRGMGVMLAAGRTLETMFKINIVRFLVMPTPRGAPPAIEFFSGLYSAAFGDDDYERKSGWKRAWDSLKLFVPGRMAAKDAMKVREQQSLKPLLFYEQKEKKEN